MSVLPAIVPPIEVRRWTLDEYHRMIDEGYLAEDERVELLKGWIVLKMSRNREHEDSVQEAHYHLLDILPRNSRIRIQAAITIAISDSEPEPDLYIHAKLLSKRKRHPEPKDIIQVVEVSDSSLSRDRTLKQAIYAEAKILVYWIINIPDRQIEIYTDPTGPCESPKYRKRRYYRNGSSVPVIIGGKEVGRIPVTSLLPS